jgi:hypothetical protein
MIVRPAKKTKGTIETLTRQPHPTSRGTLALALRVWDQRHLMSKSEVQGVVNLMILTAASHLEGFLVELIRGKLMWPLLSLKGRTVFPPKKVTSSTMVVSEEPKDLAPFGGKDVVTTEVNFDEEQKIICALLDQWISSLEGEPFGKLRERMELTIGSSFGRALGEDRACEIDLLFDLRNLIAHGRDAYVPVEMSGIPFPKFDASPLNKAVNVLRERQLLPNQASKALTAYEMIDGIFSLEVAAFLFESSRQAELKLLQLPVFAAGPLFHAPQVLPEISPATAS